MAAQQEAASRHSSCGKARRASRASSCSRHGGVFASHPGAARAAVWSRLSQPERLKTQQRLPEHGSCHSKQAVHRCRAGHGGTGAPCLEGCSWAAFAQLALPQRPAFRRYFRWLPDRLTQLCPAHCPNSPLNAPLHCSLCLCWSPHCSLPAPAALFVCPCRRRTSSTTAT